MRFCGLQRIFEHVWILFALDGSWFGVDRAEKRYRLVCGRFTCWLVSARSGSAIRRIEGERTWCCAAEFVSAGFEFAVGSFASSWFFKFVLQLGFFNLVFKLCSAGHVAPRSSPGAGKRKWKSSDGSASWSSPSQSRTKVEPGLNGPKVRVTFEGVSRDESE